MKRLVIIALLMLALLSACASTTTGNKIEPGDKLGDFTITTGVEGKFTYGFAVQCAGPGQDNSYTCSAKVGDAINVSTGLRDTSGNNDLETVWSHANYQMFINDQPVDLQAFGTIDYSHPTAGAIRFANVVITTTSPGEITVRDSGVFANGDHFSSTSTYVYTQP